MTTRDEVLAMAEQAGISISYHGSTGNPTISINADASALERLVALAVAPYKDDAERWQQLLGMIQPITTGWRMNSAIVNADVEVGTKPYAHYFIKAIDNARSAK